MLDAENAKMNETWLLPLRNLQEHKHVHFDGT